MSHDPIRDLRGDLVRAARRRLRPWWRRRPALLGVLGVLLVAAPATAAIGGLWKPDVAPMPPMRTATATAASPAAACDSAPGEFELHPKTTRTTPPAALSRALGVLRTPQTAADRAAAREATRRPGIGRVSLDGVRILGADASGARNWIAPVLVVVPARKATRDCPARPGSRRWLLAIFGQGGALIDAETLERQGTMGASGPRDDEAIVTGVVPDGVASVTVSYGKGAARTWPVRRNFFSYRVALPAEHAYQGDVTWNDASGRAIEHVGRLGAGAS